MWKGNREMGGKLSESTTSVVGEEEECSLQLVTMQLRYPVMRDNMQCYSLHITHSTPKQRLHHAITTR